MQNSKTNTVLLVVLIILVAIGLWLMLNKKDTAGHGEGENTPTGYTQTKTNQTSNDYQPAAQNTTPVSKGNVSLDLNNPYAKTYATLFTNEFAQPANFDGHFRLVAAGCGTSCFVLYALDKNSGETYRFSANSGQDYVINGNSVIITDQRGVKTTYTFNENTKQFVAS